MSRADEMSRSELGTYVASGFLADLIRDLREKGLLESEVRASMISSLDLFITTRTTDPFETWHSDLVDLYEELTGKRPERAPN